MHLDFVVGLYRLQLEEGRLFVHEHPQSASSWQVESVEELMRMPGVQRVM